MNERSDFFLILSCLPGNLEQVHKKETLYSRLLHFPSVGKQVIRFKAVLALWFSIQAE